MIPTQPIVEGAGEDVIAQHRYPPLVPRPVISCSGSSFGRRFPERADPSLSLAAAPPIRRCKALHSKYGVRCRNRVFLHGLCGAHWGVTIKDRRRSL